jgi:hypothetical protein
MMNKDQLIKKLDAILQYDEEEAHYLGYRWYKEQLVPILGQSDVLADVLYKFT